MATYLNQHEQEEFVKELSENVTNGVLADIRAGKVPKNWNGIELRALLSDRFAAAVYNLDSGRKRDYERDVIVNNL